MRSRASGWLAAFLLSLCAPLSAAPTASQPVLVSTDVGDDIDDAFALALLLRSPELELRGIVASWGDTPLRARLLQRLLAAAGREQVPVASGQRTASTVAFTQARWAARGQLPVPPVAAADLILQQARQQPGQVTLLVLGPLTDAAAALRRDPAGFRQLRRIVLMGGSLREGYRKSHYRPATAAAAEYNIAADVAAGQAVFNAGVPIEMLPLDATQVPLEEAERVALFAHGDGLTDALAQLYYQWRDSDQPWVAPSPTLFDVVAVAQLLAPTLCPLQPLRVEVDSAGFTREQTGRPNVQACLQLDRAGLIALYMQRLLH